MYNLNIHYINIKNKDKLQNNVHNLKGFPVLFFYHCNPKYQNESQEYCPTKHKCVSKTIKFRVVSEGILYDTCSFRCRDPGCLVFICLFLKTRNIGETSYPCIRLDPENCYIQRKRRSDSLSLSVRRPPFFLVLCERLYRSTLGSCP